MKRPFLIKLSILLVAVFIWAGFGSVQAGQPLSAGDHRILSQARDAVDAQQLEQARTLLKNYFEQRKQRHIYAYELYGHVLMALQQDSAARAIYEEALTQYPQHAGMTQNLAVVYSRNNDYLLAGEAYLNAWELGQQGSEELAFSAAMLFARAEKYERAIGVLRRLSGVQGAPRLKWSQLLGQCLIQNGNYRAAVTALSAATEAFPRQAPLWQLLGLAHYRSENFERAAAAFAVAQRLDPSSVGRRKLAALLLTLGAPYSAASLVGEENPALHEQAVARLLAAGSADAAVDLARTLQQQHPSQRHLLILARALERSGRLDEARSHYQQLSEGSGEIAVKSLWALTLLAWNDGQWEQLQGYLEQIVQRDSRFKKRAVRLLQVLESIDDGLLVR